MKRPAFSTAVSLSLLALVSSRVNLSHAAEPTFAILQGMCRNTKDPLQQGYCTGFIEAIAIRIARDGKNCAFLQVYIDHANADLALSDLIADLNPAEYSEKAFDAVEKFFYNKGCS